jgi:hypothetical protein
MTGLSRSGSMTRTDSEKLPAEKPLHSQRLGHTGQADHLLEITHGLDQRVPGVEQHQLQIVVKMQLAITGPVAGAAHLMQRLQQIKDPLEVTQTGDVLVLQRAAGRFGLSVIRHARQHAMRAAAAQYKFLLIARTACRKGLAKRYKRCMTRTAMQRL